MNQDKDMLLVYWQRAKASGMLEEDEKAFPSGQMLNVMVYWLTLLFFHWYGLIWYLVITVTIDSVILNFVAMLVMISLMPWATRKHRQRVCTHRINCRGTGMKALGDYLHGMGFKYGIYTDRGTCLRWKLPHPPWSEGEDCWPGLKTCASRPASFGFEAQDGRPGMNSISFGIWEQTLNLGNLGNQGASTTIYCKQLR